MWGWHHFLKRLTPVNPNILSRLTPLLRLIHSAVSYSTQRRKTCLYICKTYRLRWVTWYVKGQLTRTYSSLPLHSTLLTSTVRVYRLQNRTDYFGLIDKIMTKESCYMSNSQSVQLWIDKSILSWKGNAKFHGSERVPKRMQRRPLIITSHHHCQTGTILRLSP